MSEESVRDYGLEADFIQQAYQRLEGLSKEKLPGEPIRVLTIEDTENGFRFRDYTPEDALGNRFRIDIYDSATSGGLGLDKNVAEAMLEMQHDTLNQTPTVALPSDTTHTINSHAFTMLPTILKFYGVDVSKFHFTHIDNYIWGPRKFHEGPNKNDFASLLRRNLINRLITEFGLPEDHFHAIQAICGTKKAKELVLKLEQRWQNLKPGLILLGLGDIPEVHYAYVKKRTPRSGTFRVVKNSVSTNRTHRDERHETIPDYSITVGPADVLPIPKKFISAFGKRYAERIKVLFSRRPSNNVVASIFLEEANRNGVVFSLDKNSAQYILAELADIEK